MASAAAAAAAGVHIQTLTKGLPALEGSSSRRRSNSKRGGAVKGASSAGLRLNNDRLALKSAFYNGGSAIVVPETEGAAGGGRINMRVASKGAYVCKDCGYIYNNRKPFEKLPDDYSCPVCAAPKRRFKPYDAPVARNANDQSVRKARKAELKQADSAVGAVLPIGITVGVAALIGVYIYVNSI